MHVIHTFILFGYIVSFHTNQLTQDFIELKGLKTKIQNFMEYCTLPNIHGNRDEKR